MKKVKELSDKPSEILIQALEDLEAVEGMIARGEKFMGKELRFDMTQWVSLSPNYCSVCHAGSCLIAGKSEIQNPDSGKVNIRQALGPFEVKIGVSDVSSKLHFINKIRQGELDRALSIVRYFNLRSEGKVETLRKFLIEGRHLYACVPPEVRCYREDHREEYKNYICGVIGLFQAFDL